MKKILLIFFLFFALVLKSQVANDSVRSYNCNHDGAIFLEIVNLPQTITWYFEDELLGWIEADTMNDVYFNVSLDTLITQRCGSFKVNVGTTTKFYWISCQLGIIPNHQNVKCFGDSTGMLKRVAHSGTPPYNYEWFKDGIAFSSGPLDTLHESLTNGTYKVIVSDSDSCQDSITAVINSPDPIHIDTSIINNINCRGVNSGSIIYSVSGGKRYTASESYNYYLIRNNDTIACSNIDSISDNFSSIPSLNEITFDSLYSGDYILSIIDSFECVLNDTFSLTEPAPYQSYGSTTYPLICESDSGFLQVDSVLGGGNIQFGFFFDSIIGVNTDSIYVPFGWYQIYIEDLDFDCIDTVPIRCHAQYEINVFETISSVNCFGENSGFVIIDSIIGGNEPYDIQWGSVDNTNLFAGTYDVDIVDSIGCVHSEQFVVDQPSQILSNEILYPPSCFGISDGSIVIFPSGGVTPLSYYWLNGTGTSDSLYGLSFGVYSLVVNDGNLCLDTIKINLQDPPRLELNFLSVDSILSCYGETTLLDLVISGGIAPYSIIWNDGSSNQQRVVGAGNYSVEVIDDNGCSEILSIEITEPDQLQILLEYTNMTCDSGGTANVTSSGGTSPISFFWSTGDTLQNIDSLWRTVYWIIAIDSCGLSDSVGFELIPYELETEIIYDEITHVAEVNIVSTSSAGPFNYIWTNIFGDTISFDAITQNLCEGVYFATTTDVINGCFSLDTIVVEFLLPFGIINLETTTILEDIELWGFAPYLYLWDNGDTTQHSSICPGSHWVEVTDSIGCMIREDFTIDNIVISLDPADAIILCDLENIDIDLEASVVGGTMPFSYLWWNGSSDNPINLGMSPGNYSITVTDTNGCFVDTNFQIATITSDCVPNVFSPNGDGINDSWSLEDTFLYAESEVRIYGRFGKLIFQSVGYHTAWDGTNENGNDLPDGVYFYHLEIGNGFDPIQGTVTIIR